MKTHLHQKTISLRRTGALRAPSAPARYASWLIYGLLALLVISGGHPACADPPAPLMQYRINELAADLLKARRALNEETGLRQPNEPLHTYCERIAAPLPNESPIAYKTRLSGYIETLAQTIRATADARRVPLLRDNSTANRELWQRATTKLSYLPKRLARLRAVWQQQRLHPGVGTETALGAEMEETLLLMQNAYQALRDARP